MSEKHMPAGDWLQDGDLLYRLSNGENCDEVRVTLADGSRDLAVRAVAAGRVLSVIAADRALRAVPAGDAAMPVVAWTWRRRPYSQRFEGFEPRPGEYDDGSKSAFVKQADAQAALAAKDAEIARLTAELAAPESLAVRTMRAQISELMAERDGLREGLKICEFDKTRHLNDYINVRDKIRAGKRIAELERDALKQGVARLLAALALFGKGGWAGYQNGLGEEVGAELDAAIAAIAKESGK